MPVSSTDRIANPINHFIKHTRYLTEIPLRAHWTDTRVVGKQYHYYRHYPNSNHPSPSEREKEEERQCPQCVYIDSQLKDYSKCQQHQPISVREPSYAALSVALLDQSTTILLQQFATIFLSLRQLCFHLYRFILLFHRAITPVLPFLFSSLPSHIGSQKRKYRLSTAFVRKQIGNSKTIPSTLCL